jgi:hypothetical protein
MTGRLSVCGVALAALFFFAAPASAQGGGSGFGIGPRLTFVRGTGDLPEGSQRFSGAAIRLGGGKAALEIAMDFRSGVNGDLTERIRDYPIQGSLLLFPVRGRIAPYLLGGIGWYSQHVEQLSTTDTVLEGETTRKVGYHAGFGAELRLHRHLGFYGDYRYTFIHFGDDAEQSGGSLFGIPFTERLRMSHEGSMFAWGLTFYF